MNLFEFIENETSIDDDDIFASLVNDIAILHLFLTSILLQFYTNFSCSIFVNSFVMLLSDVVY